MWGFMSNSHQSSEPTESSSPTGDAPPMMFNPATAPATNLSSKNNKNPLTRQKRPMNRPSASAPSSASLSDSQVPGTLPTSLKSPTGTQQFFNSAPDNQKSTPAPPPPSSEEDVNKFLNGYDFNNNNLQEPQQIEQNTHNNNAGNLSIVDPGSTTEQHHYPPMPDPQEDDGGGSIRYNQARDDASNDQQVQLNENLHSSESSNNVIQESNPSSMDETTQYPRSQEDFYYSYYEHYGCYPEEDQWIAYKQQWDEYYANQEYIEQQPEESVQNGLPEEEPQTYPSETSYEGSSFVTENQPGQQQNYPSSQQQMSYPGQQNMQYSPQEQEQASLKEQELAQQQSGHPPPPQRQSSFPDQDQTYPAQQNDKKLPPTPQRQNSFPGQDQPSPQIQQQQSFPPQHEQPPQTQPNFLMSFNPVDNSGNSVGLNSGLSPDEVQKQNTLCDYNNTPSSSHSLFNPTSQTTELECSQSQQTKSMEFLPPEDNQAFPPFKTSQLPFPEPSFDKCPSPVNPDNQFQKERDSTTPLWDKKNLILSSNNKNNQANLINGGFFVPPLSGVGPSNETEPFPPMPSPRTQGFPTQLLEDARTRVISESGSHCSNESRSRHSSERSHRTSDSHSGGRSRQQSENFPSNESTGSRSRHISENHPYLPPTRPRTSSETGRIRNASGPYAGIVTSNPSTFIDHTNSAQIFDTSATSPQDQAALPQFLTQQPASQPSFQRQQSHERPPPFQRQQSNEQQLQIAREDVPPPPLQFTDSFPTQPTLPTPTTAISSRPPLSILPQSIAQSQPNIKPQQPNPHPPPQTFPSTQSTQSLPSTSLISQQNPPSGSKKEDVISPILPSTKTNYPPAKFQPPRSKNYPPTNIERPFNSTGISSSTPKIMAPPAAPGPAKSSVFSRISKQMPPPGGNSYEHINISGRYIKEPLPVPSVTSYANHQIGFQPPRPSSRSSDDALRRLRKDYEDNKIKKRTPEGSLTGGNESGFGLPLLSSTTNHSRPSSASGKILSMKSIRESATFQSTASLIAQQEAYENITLKKKSAPQPNFDKPVIPAPSTCYENHDLPTNPPLPPRPARNSPSISSGKVNKDTSRTHLDANKKGHARHGSEGSRDSVRSETSSRYTDQPYDPRAPRDYRDHRRDLKDSRPRDISYNDSFDRYRDSRDSRDPRDLRDSRDARVMDPRDPRYDYRHGPRGEPDYRREAYLKYQDDIRRRHEYSMRAQDPYHPYGYGPGRFPGEDRYSGKYYDGRGYRSQKTSLEDDMSLPVTDTLSSTDPISIDNDLDALLSEESKPSNEDLAEEDDLVHGKEPTTDELSVEDVEEEADEAPETIATADLYTSAYQFTQYHTRAQCFGPNRMVCIISAENDYDGPPPRIDIIDFKRLYWQELKELEAYPGPFIKGETPKRDVTAYCKKQANLARRHSSDSVIDDGKALLWELLALLCKQNGAVIGTDVAEILLADDMEVEQPPSSPQIKFIIGDTPSVSSSESSVPPTKLSDQDRSSSLAKITNCLYEGQRREAMEISMRSGLWDTALMIGTTLSTDVMQEVMKRFSKSLHVDDPLRSFHQLISHIEPTSCTKPGADWKKHLAIVLSNQSDKYDPSFKSVLAMADNLAEKGCIHAAHFCYIMSGVKMTAVTDKTSKIALLGLDHRKKVLNSLPYTAIQQTEVFEYAKSLGGEACIVPFQATKLFYAREVCKVGQYSKALQYLQQICIHINNAPKLYRARFIQRVLEESLRLWSLLHGKEEEPIWLQELRKSLSDRHLLKTNRSTAYSSRVTTPEIQRITRQFLNTPKQQFLTVQSVITPSDSPTQYVKNNVEYPTETVGYSVPNESSLDAQSGTQVVHNDSQSGSQNVYPDSQSESQNVYPNSHSGSHASQNELDGQGSNEQGDPQNGFVFDGQVYRHADYPGYCFYEGQWYPDPLTQQAEQQTTEHTEQQTTEHAAQQAAEYTEQQAAGYTEQQAAEYTEQQYDQQPTEQYSTEHNDGGQIQNDGSHIRTDQDHGDHYGEGVTEEGPPMSNIEGLPTGTGESSSRWNRNRVDTLTNEETSPTEVPPMAFFNPSTFGGANIMTPMTLDPGVLSDDEVKTPTNEEPCDDLDVDEDSLYSKKHREPKKEEAPVLEKKKEESGGIFSRLFKKRNNMILPDDSKPTIIWDEKLGKYINTEEPDNGPDDAPPPPPPSSLPSSTAPSIAGGDALIQSAPTSPRSTPSLRRKGGRLTNRYVDVLGSSIKKSATAPDFLK